MIPIRTSRGARHQLPLSLTLMMPGLVLAAALAVDDRTRSELMAGALFAVGISAVPLDHPTRKRILEYLRVLPGDHFRSIARNLGLSVGETRHHLDILIRAGYVMDRKEHTRTRYYTRDQHGDAERNELFSRSWAYRDLRMRILLRVRAGGNPSAKEIADALGISRQLAAYHLARLMELGLVRREGRHYQPVDAAPSPGTGRALHIRSAP